MADTGKVQSHGDTTKFTGVNFTENYSSVVTDSTLRVILIMWLINKQNYQTIDAETEF